MPTTLSPSEMAAKASFVFQGTVQQLNASTLPDVSDKSNTAIVRVDRTIQAPRALSHYDGQNITVHLADPESVKPGDEAVFFTNAWLFGNEGVAVRSMGHHPPAPETRAIHESLSDPVANLESLRTRGLFDSAERVVSGTVRSVRVPPESLDKRAPREHDADWREATIRVDENHKGAGDAEIVVRFPASHDRAVSGVHK